MRPIKFRAWDTLWDFQNTKDYKVIYGDEAYFFWARDKERYILEQFTGLTDKSGKEIYEGDVVQAEHTNFNDLDAGEVAPEYAPWIGIVIGRGGCYSIKTKTGYSPNLSNIRIISIKVIGNIHDNPELLEEAK